MIPVVSRTAGPFYIRLPRAATPVIHGPGYSFTLGRSEVARDGQDLTIIAMGVMVAVALQAAELLAQSGIQARVVNMHTLKPVDEETILAAARETGAIVTAEEHYIHGGLGRASWGRWLASITRWPWRWWQYRGTPGPPRGKS